MQPEILKADAQTRRRYIIFIVCIAVIGFALVFAAQDYWAKLETELQNKPTPERLGQILAEVKRLFGIIYSLMWLSVANLMYRAIRILQMGQSPLPTAKVIRDTPILRGRAARTRAFILLALVAVFVILLIVLALMGVRVLEYFQKIV